jgi:hypothetical protein
MPQACQLSNDRFFGQSVGCLAERKLPTRHGHAIMRLHVCRSRRPLWVRREQHRLMRKATRRQTNTLWQMSGVTPGASAPTRQREPTGYRPGYHQLYLLLATSKPRAPGDYGGVLPHFCAHRHVDNVSLSRCHVRQPPGAHACWRSSPTTTCRRLTTRAVVP